MYKSLREKIDWLVKQIKYLKNQVGNFEVSSIIPEHIKSITVTDIVNWNNKLSVESDTLQTTTTRGNVTDKMLKINNTEIPNEAPSLATNLLLNCNQAGGITFLNKEEVSNEDHIFSIQARGDGTTDLGGTNYQSILTIGSLSNRTFTINTEHNVGINTDNAKASLDVNGNLIVRQLPNAQSDLTFTKQVVARLDGTLGIEDKSSYKNHAGQIKILFNTNPLLTGFQSGVARTFDINAVISDISLSPSPTTTPPYNQIFAVSSIFDNTRGTTPVIGRLIENDKLGQTHFWRVQGSWSGKSASQINQLTLQLHNPISGFTSNANIILGRTTTGSFTINIITIGDGFSIPFPNGYVIRALTDVTNNSLSIRLIDLTRIDLAAEN